MGFHRTLQPQAIARDMLAGILRPIVVPLVHQVAFANRTADPFALDHDCLNPSGHRFVASCGDVVCVHCAKVVWR